MAITAASRTNIIELNVLAGNGAPGTTGLGALVATYNISGVAGVAASITTSASWTAKFPTFQTPEEFGKEFLEMIVPGLSAAGMAEGITIIAGLLNSGSSQADVLLASSNFLSATSVTDAAFGDYAAKFQNQTAVAIFHTVTEEKASPRALDDITSDAATIVTAKADIDGTTAAAAKVVADAAAKVVADEAAAAAAKVVADEAEAAAAKVVADEAAAAKVVADAAAAEAVLTAASTDAAAASATAEATAVSAAAALVTADALVVSTAATAALTDATALAATAVTAAATAATDATAETAANTAYDAALAGGVAATVSLANGTKLIAANTAALSAAASATAAAASTTAAAADAAAAAAVTAAATALTTSTAATAASTTAANAAVAAAAATADTSDDAGPAAGIVADNAGVAAATAANAAVTAGAAANAAAATAAAAIVDNATTAASLVAANAAVTAATAATTATAAYTTATAATAATTDDTAAAALAATAATQATTADATVTAATAAGLVDRTAAAFTLTTAVDTKTTLAGNDTFSALVTTLGVGDNINGGAGTDTVTLTSVLAADTSVAGFTLAGIEKLGVALTDGRAGTLDTLSVNMLNSPVSTIELSGQAASGFVDSLTLSNVAAGTILSMSNAAQLSLNATFVPAATASLTSDAVSVSLNGVGPATGTNNGNITIGGGMEIMNLEATGAASRLATVIWGGSALNITGDQNLTITSALAATATDIDASAATGKVSFSVSDVANRTSPLLADLIVQGGSGNDTLNVAGVTTAARELNVNGGAGNDTVVIGQDLVGANAISLGDVLVGGDGTDTLSNTTARFTALNKLKTTGVSGFEVISVADALSGTVTPANAQATGITVVDLNAGGTGTLVMPAGAMTVSANAALTGALTLTDTGTAITDSVSIVNRKTTALDIGAGNAINTNGYETLNISSSGGVGTATLTLGAITMASDAGTTAAPGTDTVNFTGAQKVTTGAITAEVINASGLTVAATGTTFSMGAAAVGVTTITGSAGADTLVGDAKSTINGGGGKDNITGGSGNDTLNGGDANDTITTNAGNDTVSGGAGNDTIISAGNLSKLDVIDGGDGTDTLSVTDASLTAIKAMTITEVNAFNAALTSVEGLQTSDAWNQGTFDLGYVSGVTTVTLGAGITGAETIAGMASGSTINMSVALSDTLTTSVTGALGGTADTLNFNMVRNTTGTDYDAITIVDVETLNINSSEATANAAVIANTIGIAASATITALGGSGAAQTINITGTESLTVDTVMAVGTINASGMTTVAATDAGLTMSVAHTKAQTITGSGKVDTIFASTKNDTINAGGGADTITGSAGQDVIDGGTGTDLYTTVTSQVAANIGGAGTGTSVGVVINLGTTAVTNATVLSKTGKDLSAQLTTLAAGSESYVFTGSSATNSSSVSTLTSIENVTLAGNGQNGVWGSAGANVITGGGAIDYISGGAGNDTISGLAGADNLDGGAGNDSFNYLLLADLFTTQASVDTIAGGTGTDSITGGTSGTAFTIANNDVWTTRITSIETIKLNANSATTNTIALDVTAYAAGVRTIDASAVTGATGNTIDISEFVATGATTLTGSATGSTIFTGGAGPDLMQGGSAVDTFTVNAGNTGDAAKGGLGNDIFSFTAALLAANSASTATYDGEGGTDIMDITDNGATIVDADFRGMSGIETLTTGDGVNSITLEALADAAGITTITDGAGADTIVMSNAAFNNTVTINAGNGIDIITLGAQTATVVLTGANVAANDSDVITGFTTGTDKLNLDALTTATATTVLTGSQTNTAGLVYFLAGQSAGAADSVGAAATAVTAAGTMGDAAVTSYIIVVDDNSTGIFSFLGAAGGNQVQGAELTVMGTVDALMVTGDLLFA